MVDGERYAVGLIFAGASELPEAAQAPPDDEAGVPRRVESYGVANPISEVLERLNIELVI